MDIKKLMVCPKKIKEGVWVEIAKDGASVLVSYASSRAYRNKVQALASKSNAAAEDIEEIAIEAMPGTVVLDWKGLDYGDEKNIPYSDERCLEYLLQSPVFYSMVANASESTRLFRFDEVKEAEKNSVPASSGKPSTAETKPGSAS